MQYVYDLWFQEKKGSSSFLLDNFQYVYDMWIENSILSADFRNGRDKVKMRYDKYDR